MGVNETRLPAQLPCNEPLAIETTKNEKREELIIGNRDTARQNITAHVQTGSTLSLVVLNLVDKSAGTINTIVEGGGKIEVILAETGRFNATDLNIVLKGDAAVARIYSVYYAKNSDVLDLNYRITLLGKNTKADMTVKGALTGNADKIFRGTLDFAKGSKGAVGHENEAVTVLSDTVHNRSVPLMLSHEDDVDGHHGVTIGKIDDAKLFYLTSRGLTENDAGRLILAGAAEPIIKRLPADGNLVAALRKALDLAAEDEDCEE